MNGPFQKLIENLSSEHNFSAVERETLVLALEGLSLNEIAQRLDRKFVTIQKRMATIYNKVGITGDAPGKLETLRSMLLSQPQKEGSENLQLESKTSQPLTPVKDTLQNVPMAGDKLYGREEELEQLKKCLLAGNPALICVYGLGGFGKTTLVSKAVRELVENFDHVIWLALQGDQSYERGLELILQNFTAQGGDRNALVGESSLDKCISAFRQYSCLVVLEDFQNVLPRASRSKEVDLDQQTHINNWQSFLQKLYISQHQSSVVIVSRKQPVFFAQEDGSQKVYSLDLEGLSETAIEQFLVDHKVVNQPFVEKSTLKRLRDLSSGHPLLLKLSFSRIKNLFGGNIEAFLDTGSLVYGGLKSILDEGFADLVPLEKVLLYWLLVNRDPVPARTPISFRTLIGDVLLHTEDDVEEVGGYLDDLVRRSLIDANAGIFKLHDLIEDYVRERFIEDFLSELMDDSQEMYFLNHCALIKAKSNDSIRRRQEQEIIIPILDRLCNKLFHKIKPKDFFVQLLQRAKKDFEKDGYLAGNVAHLCRLLKIDLENFDFSGLPIRQVNFRGLDLRNVSFFESKVLDCVFNDVFGSVLCVRCSPDSRFLASSDTDGQICIWSYSSRELLYKLNAHNSWILQIRFSPDGTLLASASEDGTCCIWCVETRQLLWKVEATGKLTALDFSPDGRLIAAAGDGKVYLLDVQSGQSRELVEPGGGIVWSCSFSPDGEYLVHDSSDRTVRLWNLKDESNSILLREKLAQCRALTYSPDGRYLARVSDSTVIRIWDTELKHDIAELRAHFQDIWAITFVAGSHCLISAGADRQICVWDIQNEKLLRKFQGHKAPIYSIAYHSDDSEIVSGSGDQSIRFWDYFETQLDRQLLSTLQGFSAGVRSIAFLPKTYSLIAGSSDQNIYAWELPDDGIATLQEGSLETVVFPQHHSGFIWTVARSSQQDLIASAGEDGMINLWDAHTKQLLKQLAGPTWTIFSLKFNKKGNRLVSGSLDETIQIWDIESEISTKIPKAHLAGVRSACFTHDETRIVSCGNDNLVKVWDVTSGKCLKSWTGHQSFVQFVDVNPDESLVASCSDDKTIRLWDLNAISSQESAEVAVLQGIHTDWVRGVCFSPDGQLLASGGEDGLVCLWNVETREPIWQSRHDVKDKVKCVTFSDDGKLLASGSDHGVVKLWNVDEILHHKTSGYITTLRTLQPYKGLDITNATFSDHQQPEILRRLGAVTHNLLPVRSRGETES